MAGRGLLRTRARLVCGLVQPAGRFEVTIRIARIVRVVGVGVAVLEEILHHVHRDGEAQALAEDLHVRHAHDLALQIEERPILMMIFNT